MVDPFPHSRSAHAACPVAGIRTPPAHFPSPAPQTPGRTYATRKTRVCTTHRSFLMTCIARLLLSGLLILAGQSTALALTAAPGDTLILTVVNHSDHTLTYKGVTGTKTGNYISLTSKA